MKKTIIYLVTLCFIQSCALLKPSSPELLVDTVAIIDSPHVEQFVRHFNSFKEEKPLTWNLINTELRASLEWEEATLNAAIRLELSPKFAIDSLQLDALGIKILDTLRYTTKNENTFIVPKVSYNQKIIQIHFDTQLLPTDTIWLYFKYKSKPNELLEKGLISSEIEKGLFFINELGYNLDKPQQVWTQGETIYNRSWLPTIDQPNAKTTQDFYVTVDTPFTVLSNGRMVYYLANEDGSRTYYWHQEKPHAPYLAMLAIGKFHIVEDELEDLPFYYYMEPAHAKNAKLIFGKAPQIVSFFSQKLNTPYPWEKSAHVAVRDFSSGAMENTSAIIYMEQVLHDSIAHNDYTYEDYIVHEIAHHWFGNLVTCKSWSNLVLNEGFTTYCEYLWKEHHYNENEAIKALMSWRTSYFNESNFLVHPLINFHYAHPDNMFNAHSYSKGALAAHTLRKKLGDEAFFKGLTNYLNQNAFGVADIYSMKIGMEQASGQQLDELFEQLYFSTGHPVIDLKYHFNERKNTLNLKVKQIQNPKTYSLFSFNLDLNLKTDLEEKTFRLKVDKSEQEFNLPVNGKIEWAAPNLTSYPLAEYNENKPSFWLIPQLKQGGASAYMAVNHLEKIWEELSDSFQLEVLRLILSSDSDPIMGNSLLYKALISNKSTPDFSVLAKNNLHNGGQRAALLLEYLVQKKQISYNELKSCYNMPSYAIKRQVVNLLPLIDYVRTSRDFISWLQTDKQSEMQEYLAMKLVMNDSDSAKLVLKDLALKYPAKADFLFKWLNRKGLDHILSEINFLINYASTYSNTNRTQYLKEKIEEWLQITPQSNASLLSLEKLSLILKE